MTEAEWQGDSPLCSQIDFLEGQVSNQRRFRLFACACCRRAWKLLHWEVARRIIDLAEEYADGQTTTAELEAARVFTDFASVQSQYEGRAEAGTQCSFCELKALQAVRELALPTFDTYLIAQDTSRNLARDFIPDSENEPGRSVFPDDVELAERVKLLRDIFGNPFRPVTFDPAWRTSTAVAIAEQMYKSRDFSAMPILADALEDAGCDNKDILRHCREPGVHVRGCWVVDLVLGKE